MILIKFLYCIFNMREPFRLGTLRLGRPLGLARESSADQSMGSWSRKSAGTMASYQ